MDIRPPKHPIRSLREFLVEMGTITCGILIALTLEAGLHQYEKSELRNQAITDFQAELTANAAVLTAIGGDQKTDMVMLRGLIGYGAARLAHQPPPELPELRGRAFSDLSASAWQTALATQAIGQLSHDQVRALAAAYELQTVFDDLSEKAMVQWLQMAAYGSQPAQLSDDEVRILLPEVRVAAAYTLSLQAIRTELLARETAASRML